MSKVKGFVLGAALSVAVVSLCGCATKAVVSGHETDSVVREGARGADRYDGCFWNDRLWEDDWLTKKDTERTLKIVRVRLVPWQSLASVVTLGVWVPMYVEWELNGDGK